MVKNLLIGGLLLSVISMYALMSSTTPSDAHPVVILLFFFLLYAATMIIILAVLMAGSRLIVRISRRKHLHALGYGQAYMVASLLALAPVILLAMKSVGGISVREVALIILFEGIALFYLWKRR